MNHFLLSCLTVLTFLAAPGVTGSARAESQKPNIVIIYTDDMGIGDVSSYGKGIGLKTPNIDRLAREGTRFTRYYSASPICSPSRAALLTGRFPARVHITSFLHERVGNIDCDQNDYLDADIPTLADILRKGGYATFHVGKWHLGGGRDVDNAPAIGEYGFDKWISTWESPDPHPKLGIKYAPWDKRTEPGQVPRHKRTEYMVNESLEFLKRHKGKPCFINLWPDDVHTPYRPGPAMARKHGANSKDESKTPKKSFLAVLEEYDRQIGRLLDGVRELGLEDNTIIVFTSDNGPSPNYEDERTQQLRGQKLSLYEGGIRMPFLVRWPGRVPAGRVETSTTLSAVDLILSLPALAGVDGAQHIASELDGEDMSTVLLGKSMVRKKALLWEYGRRKDGLGRGRGRDRSPNVAIMEGDWKLLINDDGTSRQLYNLQADNYETKPVKGESEIADRLAAKALEWRKSMPGRSHPTTFPLERKARQAKASRK